MLMLPQIEKKYSWQRLQRKINR